MVLAESHGLAALGPHLRHFHRNLPDPGLNSALWMIPAAHNRRAAARGASLGKRG